MTRISSSLLAALLVTFILGGCTNSEGYEPGSCEELESFWDGCGDRCDYDQGQAIFETCYGDKADLDLSTPWLDVRTAEWQRDGSEHVELDLGVAMATLPGAQSPARDKNATLVLDDPSYSVEAQLQDQGFGESAPSLAESVVSFVREHRNPDVIDAFDDVFSITHIPLLSSSTQKMGMRITANRDGAFFVTFHAFGF